MSSNIREYQRIRIRVSEYRVGAMTFVNYWLHECVNTHCCGGKSAEKP